MNQITIRFKVMGSKPIIIYSEANDVLLNDGFIQLRRKTRFGNVRTLAMFDKDDVSSVTITSEQHITINN